METDERKGRPSASGMQRVMACPGSFLFEQSFPDDRDEFAKQMADEGTAIHGLMELNETSEDATKEEIADRLRRIEAALLAEWGETDYTELREKRLWLGDMVSAKCDVIYVNKGATRALVIDLKTGFVKVSAANNWQLKTQAAVVFSNYSKYVAVESAPSLQEVTVAIAQARTGVAYDKVVITKAENQINKTQILAACYEALQPDARRFAGEQCQYCRARAGCPTAATFAMVVSAADQNGGLTNPKTLAALHLARKSIWGILEKVKAELSTWTDENLLAVGLARKAGYQLNEYDPKQAFKLLNDPGLVTGAEFTQYVDLNYSRLSEAVLPKMVAKGMTEAAAKKELRKLLDPAASKTTRAPSIVAAKTEKAIEV